MSDSLRLVQNPEKTDRNNAIQKTTFRTLLRFKRRNLKTYFQQFLHKRVLDQIEKHCVFIGYPRSGHTLVASLLDAHPNIVISKGVDPLKYVEHGFKLTQIYALYLTQAQRFAKKGGKSNGYSYIVPNQWNGKFDQLKVIGDKSGDLLSERLLANPEILEKFLDEYQAKHKFIHVIRNPFDNITTYSTRNKISLGKAATHYFSLCERVENARRNIFPGNWLDIKIEDLIRDPKPWIAKSCLFLGQEVTQEYLEDSAGIVFKSPHETRFTAPWTHHLIHRVETEIAKYPLLSTYRFESEKNPLQNKEVIPETKIIPAIKRSYLKLAALQ